MSRRGTNSLQRMAFGVALACAACPAFAAEMSGLYSTATITSGTAPARRDIGFANCLRQIVVRVSGDPRLAADPRVAAEVRRAGDLIASHSFRDRMSGTPIHDEQGSYDRPHDLTCVFDRPRLDAFLATLGRKPWLDRPRLTAVIAIRDFKGADSLLAKDSLGPRDNDMRSTLAAAAAGQGLDLELPDAATLAASHLDIAASVDAPTVDALARQSGAGKVLVGTLVWRDKNPPGWVAEWHIAGQPSRWSISGVGFDDAFRAGIGGAAQVLSGNGEPG